MHKLILCLLVAGCGSGRGVVTVNVTANPPVNAVDLFRVTVTQGGKVAGPFEFRPMKTPFDLPPAQSFALGFGPDHTGPFDVRVEAIGPPNVVLATGNRNGDISASGSVTLDIILQGNIALDMAPTADMAVADLATADSGTADLTMVPDMAVAPVRLALNQSDPFNIAVDKTNVYWTNPKGGTVMKVPIGGGMPVAVAMAQGSPHSVASDNVNVFWTNNASSLVMRAPIGGGMPVAITMTAAGTNGLALFGPNVYWTTNTTVARSDKLMPNPAALVTMLKAANGLDADGTYLFWTDAMDGALYRAPIAGGVPTSLSNSGGIVDGHPKSDGATVYWNAFGSGSIRSVLVGGGLVNTLAFNQQGPANLAIDTTHAYWPNRAGNSIAKIPLAGGSVVILATGQSEPVGIAVDATYVYWTNYAGGAGMGSVMRLPKK